MFYLSSVMFFESGSKVRTSTYFSLKILSILEVKNILSSQCYVL
jgi:hypothetical protein